MCRFCGSELKLTPDTERVGLQDDSAYSRQFRDRAFADADCPMCEAKYTAWMDDGVITDTSFRSTFNDEPGPDDLPKWDTETITRRTGAFVPENHGMQHYARKHG